MYISATARGGFFDFQRRFGIIIIFVFSSSTMITFIGLSTVTIKKWANKKYI